jgi:hypothetical protein
MVGMTFSCPLFFHKRTSSEREFSGKKKQNKIKTPSGQTGLRSYLAAALAYAALTN